jgi:hypothetical protein
MVVASTSPCIHKKGEAPKTPSDNGVTSDRTARAPLAKKTLEEPDIIELTSDPKRIARALVRVHIDALLKKLPQARQFRRCRAPGYAAGIRVAPRPRGLDPRPLSPSAHTSGEIIMEQRARFQSGESRHTPVHLTALVLKSIGRVYDMNLSAARVLLQTQARAASAMGLPDWSGLFNVVDDRARHVFSTGAEQLLNTAQRANDAAAELQREVGRVVETQTATVAQTLQEGFEELGSQANDGLSQLVQTARQQAEEAERVASSVGEGMRDVVERSGEAAEEARAGDDKERSRRNKVAA